MTNEIHNISNNAYIINTVIIVAWFYWAKLGSPIRIFLPQCFLYKLHYAPQMVSVWVLAIVNKQYVKIGPGQCICKDNMIHDTSVFSFFLFFSFFLLFVCFCCCFFYFGERNGINWDPTRIRTWLFWIWSDALTIWATGALVLKQKIRMWYTHRHRLQT